MVPVTAVPGYLRTAARPSVVPDDVPGATVMLVFKLMAGELFARLNIAFDL